MGRSYVNAVKHAANGRRQAAGGKRQAASGKRQAASEVAIPSAKKLVPVLRRSNATFNDMPLLKLEDRDAWKAAMDLAEDVYLSTRGFPRDEICGLRLQVRRAAVSIVSNIAEGHGRVRGADNARYVLMVRGR